MSAPEITPARMRELAECIETGDLTRLNETAAALRAAADQVESLHIQWQEAVYLANCRMELLDEAKATLAAALRAAAYAYAAALDTEQDNE